MKVLRVRPKHYPEVIDIDCSLESLQKEKPTCNNHQFPELRKFVVFSVLS